MYALIGRHFSQQQIILEFAEEEQKEFITKLRIFKLINISVHSRDYNEVKEEH